MIDLASARDLCLPGQIELSSDDVEMIYQYDAFASPDTSFEERLIEYYEKFDITLDIRDIATTPGTYGAYRLLTMSLGLDTLYKTSSGNFIHSRAFNRLGVTTIQVNYAEASCFPDLDDLDRQLSGTSGQYVYVNATDGRYETDQYMRGLADLLVRHDARAIFDLDTQFVSHRGDAPVARVASVPKLLDNSILLCSCSKEWGLPGIRFGYMIGSRELMRHIRDYKSDTLELESLFGRRVASRALEDGVVDMRVAELVARNDLVRGMLDEVEISYISPDTGVNVFIQSQSAQRLVANLKEVGVDVAEGVNYGERFSSYIRVTLSASIEDLRYSLKQIIKAENNL